MAHPLDLTARTRTRSAPRASATAWRVTNVVVLFVLLAANGAAGSGALSGESIGTIANRYRSDFLPANYVFGIWSLIYAGLTAFAVFQALPRDDARRAADRLGGWWLASSALNIAWITAFSFSAFGVAMLVMVALLLSLIVIDARLRPLDAEPGLAVRWCVRWPFAVYLAWISVALIANSFQYAHVVGWGGLGIAEARWAAIMMVVATALGVIMVARRGLWPFPLVVAWALWGIGARHADIPLLRTTAILASVAGIGCGALVLWWRRRPLPA